MMFAKQLRAGVRSGAITSSVRIWMNPRVKVGGRYRMEEGEIEVDSIEEIGFPDITPELARASGFLGVLDLLKVAKHGKGERIYLVRFQYIPPRAAESRRVVRKRKALPAIGESQFSPHEEAATAVALRSRMSRKSKAVANKGMSPAIQNAGR